MSLSSLSAYAATPLYDRPPQRRRSWNGTDGRGNPESSPAAQASAILDAEAAPAPASQTYVSHVFKADLTSLGLRDGAREAAEALGEEPTFLAAFSSLLASVMSGDSRGAQAAARALQQQIDSPQAEVEEGLAPEAVSRFFDDLQALIRTARQGDAGGAQTAAQSLASDIRNGLGSLGLAFASTRVEPSTAAEGATAAYETLMELNHLGASAA